MVTGTDRTQVWNGTEANTAPIYKLKPKRVNPLPTRRHHRKQRAADNMLQHGITENIHITDDQHRQTATETSTAPNEGLTKQNQIAQSPERYVRKVRQINNGRNKQPAPHSHMNRRRQQNNSRHKISKLEHQRVNRKHIKTVQEQYETQNPGLSTTRNVKIAKTGSFIRQKRDNDGTERWALKDPNKHRYQPTSPNPTQTGTLRKKFHRHVRDVGTHRQKCQ